MAAANKCSFEILPHPNVFSRFSPSLFLNQKTSLRGRTFGNSEGVIDVVDEYLGDQRKGFYFEGINKLEQQWRKCTEAKGGYIEQ